MAKAKDTSEYVLLPAHGLRAKEPSTPSEGREFLLGAKVASRAQAFDGPRGRNSMRVIGSIAPDGAKLVELTPSAALALRAAQPGLRLVPVVYYTTADVRPRPGLPGPTRPRGSAAGKQTITVQVGSSLDQSPIADAYVVAYTDFSTQTGVQSVTNAKGQAKLSVDKDLTTLDRLYVYPITAYWTLRKKDVVVSSNLDIALRPLDLAYTDGLRHFYGNPPLSAGEGVTVGVIDTGVADHPDLVVAGGANTVPGEDPENYDDNGQGHGTHVAGIIAARGEPPDGVRGVAPGVTLMAYRVFGEGSASASSFAIAMAIDQATSDGCDLLNMSVGGGEPDDVLRAAIEDARAAGSLCIISAGNGGRAPVSFPASEEMAIAVSALGRKGTFPNDAAEVDDIAPPYGTDKKDFIAGFSNVGLPIDVTGPGVAIISTYPGGYTEISGTSMACPAVTGAGARAIAADSEILDMNRDADRSAAMVKALLASTRSLGFEPTFEGHGLPEPE
ncbi:hypothetical protein BH18ACT4_BH18ACT4_03120 [soil metagenome]